MGTESVCQLLYCEHLEAEWSKWKTARSGSPGALPEGRGCLLMPAYRHKDPENPLEAVGFELSGTILDVEIYNAIKRKTKETELKCVVLFHSSNGFFFIFPDS